ncbi:MAG: OadG family transporter subunit [Candidatus Spyradenecus sp.]
MLQQGLVLLCAGMGIAVGFLSLLAVVTITMGKYAPRLNLFPESAPKKAAAPAASADDAAIAVAIAVASQR